MTKVNVFEVKAKLSEYLDRAAGGEHVVICRHNKPVAELRPVEAVRSAPRLVGPIPGRPTFEISPAFFEPMSEEELNAWEGPPAGPPAGQWPSSTADAQVQVAERAPGAAKAPRGRAPRRRS